MRLHRASGVLLHPTSFPGKYGIGEIGSEAREFIDFLSMSKQQLWQILPLNPVGFGESPYQSYCSFAGNYLLISVEKLTNQGLLTEEDLAYVPQVFNGEVDYSLAGDIKNKLLHRAFWRFKGMGNREDYNLFKEENSFWLRDYALFMSLKDNFDQRPWNEWGKEISSRKESALRHYEGLLAEKIEYYCFLQYIFSLQWLELKEYTNSKGIKIIGDLPIFVSYDSSDTWLNPSFFELDDQGYPAKVAGVPPDYFSETGQLWGNPHYRWDKMAEDDYFWWRQRIKKLLEFVDVIRIDHFRGFEAYWEIPAGEKTAVRGRWVKGPGEKFFAALIKYMGDLPIIAEDLGFITPQVHELKDAFGFPGMKVLQFINEESIINRPKEEKAVYYTGTHDNETLLGWYRDKVLACLERPPMEEGICWDFMELVYSGNAAWVMVPLQDILCLDNKARMNTPGTIGGNWQWRYLPGALTPELSERLAFMTKGYGREAKPDKTFDNDKT